MRSERKKKPLPFSLLYPVLNFLRVIQKKFHKILLCTRFSQIPIYHLQDQRSNSPDYFGNKTTTKRNISRAISVLHKTRSSIHTSRTNSPPKILRTIIYSRAGALEFFRGKFLFLKKKKRRVLCSIRSTRRGGGTDRPVSITYLQSASRSKQTGRRKGARR